MGELGHGVRHVVGGRHGGVVAHGVLLHAGLRHLRLPVGSQRRAEVPRSVHASKLLVGLLDWTQNICH